jgi:hypothetical protein
MVLLSKYRDSGAGVPNDMGSELGMHRSTEDLPNFSYGAEKQLVYLVSSSSFTFLECLREEGTSRCFGTGCWSHGMWYSYHWMWWSGFLGTGAVGYATLSLVS